MACSWLRKICFISLKMSTDWIATYLPSPSFGFCKKAFLPFCHGCSLVSSRWNWAVEKLNECLETQEDSDRALAGPQWSFLFPFCQHLPGSACGYADSLDGDRCLSVTSPYMRFLRASGTAGPVVTTIAQTLPNNNMIQKAPAAKHPKFPVSKTWQMKWFKIPKHEVRM